MEFLGETPGDEESSEIGTFRIGPVFVEIFGLFDWLSGNLGGTQVPGTAVGEDPAFRSSVISFVLDPFCLGRGSPRSNFALIRAVAKARSGSG